jgi:hypothetical protein
MKRRTIKPSENALTELRLSKKKKIEKWSWRPYDRPDCMCELIIPTRIMSKDFRMYHCPKAENWKKEGLSKYEVVCAACGDLLGSFYARDGKLTGEYYDLHYYSYFDAKSWRGCFGFNVDPFTSEPRFECACGSTSIEGRYSKVKIEKQHG